MNNACATHDFMHPVWGMWKIPNNDYIYDNVIVCVPMHDIECEYLVKVEVGRDIQISSVLK